MEGAEFRHREHKEHRGASRLARASRATGREATHSPAEGRRPAATLSVSSDPGQSRSVAAKRASIAGTHQRQHHAAANRHRHIGGAGSSVRVRSTRYSVLQCSSRMVSVRSPLPPTWRVASGAAPLLRARVGRAPAPGPAGRVRRCVDATRGRRSRRLARTPRPAREGRRSGSTSASTTCWTTPPATPGSAGPATPAPGSEDRGCPSARSRSRSSGRTAQPSSTTILWWKSSGGRACRSPWSPRDSARTPPAYAGPSGGQCPGIC